MSWPNNLQADTLPSEHKTSRSKQTTIMSKAYEKKKTPSSGTGLFITKDLKAGELVLRDKTPFVAVLDSSVLTKACSWCCLLTEEASLDDEFSVSACTGCKIVRYCGKVREFHLSHITSIFQSDGLHRFVRHYHGSIHTNMSAKSSRLYILKFCQTLLE